ncbi:hypothetical protein SAMN04488030_1119 [Aliiroseovarius halocynthiae]|uniref:Uncharacterized protein n=1 Tax=Aliiroseovarius halocynthiae TaxID=985055 RepID=A0A545SVP3_9RHOB|nr:hypothetical protein [Aliiroseovarius halocynthiae]TQV69034.1 hypothetical protein FIL88_05545 [Aliiroseovarius halocynthiae]SMR71785.1 hypothetical protein SAMN04488030_1119 [Aliiroseovarius halocynthiae]
MHKVIVLAGVLVTTALPASAQNFTTAAEVRPILNATQGNWVAVREYDGQDLLYFTHLLAWRCGLDAIHFSVNGGVEQKFDAEPCYEGEATPNALKVTDMLPYQRFDLQSVDTVDVRIVYDDGEESAAGFNRGQIQIQ